MPVDNLSVSVLGNLNAQFGLKAFLLLFLVFYSVFTLILFRQIQVMGRTVILPAVPFLKFLAIIHVGITLAILFITIGTF